MPALARDRARAASAAAASYGGDESAGRDHHPPEARHAQRRADFLPPLRLPRRSDTVEEIFDLTKIDPWFLHQLREIHRDGAGAASKHTLATLDADAPAARQAVRLLRRPAGAHPQDRFRHRARRPQEGAASTPPTGWSTPARPSSRPSRPTTTRATATRTRSCPRRRRRS